MKRIALVVLALVVLALIIIGFVCIQYYGDGDYGHRPVITDLANHNNQMNECVNVALKKHPGAVIETEVEIEDGKLIADVDIQGEDGKSWEIECVLATKEIIEDKQEH